MPFNHFGGAYAFGFLVGSHAIPPPSLHGGEGSSISSLVPPIGIVDSKPMVSLKCGDFSLLMDIRLMSLLTPAW